MLWIHRTVRASQLLSLAFLCLCGCSTLKFWQNNPDPLPPSGVVLRGEALQADTSPSKVNGELAAAHEKYRSEDYAAAEKMFHRIAENKKNSALVAEEARFYEAECLYRRDYWPDACDTYHRMLLDFNNGVYRQEACARMYEIANFWLEDTRAEIRARGEKDQGKRTFVIPAKAQIHFDKRKPTFDQEGRAVQAMENVYFGDTRGVHADKALFYAGKVKLYREDFKEADHYFSLLVRDFPNSPLAPEAAELAVYAMQRSTGGPDYDGRKAAEAYDLIVKSRQGQFGQLDEEKSQRLDRQLVGIRLQQAEKDWRTADYYRRRGRPGSAYFLYETIRRRYPGTDYEKRASEELAKLRKEYDECRAREIEGGWRDKVHKGWNFLMGKPNNPYTAPESPATPPTMLPPPSPEAAPSALPRSLPGDISGS